MGRGGVFKEYLEINTVDAFQGREKDVIIFNCVRSSPQPTEGTRALTAALGFLVDERRLNVAITRPRHLLAVVGDSRTLSLSDTWRAMMDHTAAGHEVGGGKTKRILIDDH